MYTCLFPQIHSNAFCETVTFFCLSFCEGSANLPLYPLGVLFLLMSISLVLFPWQYELLSGVISAAVSFPSAYYKHSTIMFPTTPSLTQ